MEYERLKQKIEEKTARLGIIGMGYVGLPLAVEIARAGYAVTGFDVQQKKVDWLNSGHNYIGDVVESDLAALVKNGRLRGTTDYAALADCDCVSICVPTPLDIYQQPDISYVQASAESVAQYAHSGMLVILESTTYPGTTEEIIQPLLEARGLRVGVDIFLAFSPERVDPGNKQYKTKNTPKVVGGVTHACTALAAQLYGQVLAGGICEVSSPKVAEMEKILENTFRNINIALANEMAILCDRMGIPVWEVIDAAKTKPYGYMAFYPGPGLGGHCIPLDPFYLTWKARAYNYHTRLIEIAGEINNGMPEYIIGRVSRILNRQKKPLNGSRVFLLGVAYKPDIDDLRESPVLKIITLLEREGAEVCYNDPFIPSFTHEGKTYESIPLDEAALQNADVTVITTNHSAYDPAFIAAHAPAVFDTRGATRDVEGEHVERL
ncbi:nucleotide sugar dehydrogenase [Ethanoligenens harbinense]|uniref:Nucleotide sugar dehydrogenase n=1 Tax=Ethanoligenens harbinense (strain DSM 18485 / JCM 12961 / CGMCC 1.5033 / YUAN-3) TaxID=663278 RepID=E6U9X0_ETHHY|nr:nucleotide sugar dehydrogenase [Ethanoligenens harbinense]ADU26236.1 nucleotide sugar dehydrogenase [Ethanoligenens harbinense YUAN-3]AVQ95371.1 nucleotide sugar dehydrogenase [Ethanoligenens harbinense YUAN-3]AYF38037.1 nucleotide sugar dehydrogenase [Ethanoligenens harbinense]AYF40782.1 nucleotide sugar dehydrogenase [Ethanoligenens harbinense]QCN91613.1 nucleotide sugar dehydrogenase [Ethanoligenens harbinense]